VHSIAICLKLLSTLASGWPVRLNKCTSAWTAGDEPAHPEHRLSSSCGASDAIRVKGLGFRVRV